MGTGVFEELPKNGGAEYRPKGKPRHVYDHDWLIKELGKVAPFGIYNLNNNVGYVNLGQSRDTAEFASESVARWWHFIDEENFPGCRKLFIVCDGGGSNGSRVRLWKWALACFAEFYGLEIHVSHLPPGTSKWKALRSFEWVSAWLSGIVPSGAPPPPPPAFAATWLGGKAGVNALTFPEPQAIGAESPRQSAFAAYARPNGLRYSTTA